ncbi:MAG: hypothetical protein AB1798_23015, partial [Spirochaetota bacterium]
TKVMVSKTPLMTYSSFTILKPLGANFSFVFYNLPKVLETIEFFFAQTLHKETAVPSTDAKKAAKLVVSGLQKFNIW